MTKNAEMKTSTQIHYEDPGENILTSIWSPERGEVELHLTPGHHEVEEMNAVPLSIDVAPEHLPHIAETLLQMYKEIMESQSQDGK